MRKPALIFTVLSLLCFALPFFVVSCGGQTVNTVTGLSLITGQDVPVALSGGGTQHVPPNAWAIAAIILAIVALFLMLIRRQDPAGVGSWAAATLCAAVICLVAVRLSARDALSHQFVLGVRVAYGYYLSLLFMLAAAVAGVLAARPGKAPAPPAHGTNR